ncbi:hypothetical protein BVX94_03950, partial [bacterium B17]
MPFKECTNCDAVWEKREDFLQDPYVLLVGYQVNYGDLNAGLFIFNHDTEACGTSLGLEAEKFTDMHEGSIFETQRVDAVDCPGYCDHKKMLDACHRQC